MAKGRHPRCVHHADSAHACSSHSAPPSLSTLQDTPVPPWRQRGLFQRRTSPTSAEPVFLYLAPAGTGRGKDPVGGPPDWTPDWKRSVTLPLQNPKFPTQYPRARALGKETWLAAVNKGEERKKKGSRRAGYHIPSLLSPNASWMLFAFYLVLM